MKLLHKPDEKEYDIFLEKYGENTILSIVSFLKQLKTSASNDEVSEISVRGFSLSDIDKILRLLTVFYGLSPVEYGDEKTFKIRTSLAEEIKHFEGSIKRMSVFIPYLDFKNDVFLYHGTKLDIAPTGYVYIILRFLFNHFNGKSGEIGYGVLCKKLSTLDTFKRKSQKDIRSIVRKYITSNTEGLGETLGYNTQVKPSEKNGQKLIGVNRGVGIYFNLSLIHI
jgi:hypothetical protein